MRVVDGGHIVVEPDVLGGEPHISGRRIGVSHIAVWIVYQGASPEDIASEFHLSLGEVHAALAYYYDHKAEVDAAIAVSQQQGKGNKTADMFETVRVDEQGRATRAVATLDAQTTQRIRDILVRHGVTHAGVFGSFARGEADVESDVDIVIEPPEGMTLFGLAGLGNDLEAELGRSVDILTYRSLRPRFHDAVQREQVVIL